MVGRHDISGPSAYGPTTAFGSGADYLHGRGRNNFHCGQYRYFPHRVFCRAGVRGLSGNDSGPSLGGLIHKNEFDLRLEMLSIVQTAADPDVDLDGRCITFYIDSNNAICALISGDTDTVIISVLVRIFLGYLLRYGGLLPGLNAPHRTLI